VAPSTPGAGDLSLEVVYDTPRPEGYGVRLRNLNDTETDCAFDFSDELVTFYTDVEADIAYVYDRDSDTALMWGLDDPNSGYVTELQDAGWHESMDAVGWAPPDGWSVCRWSSLPGTSTSPGRLTTIREVQVVGVSEASRVRLGLPGRPQR
jgi:hypothetical protein